ncbi:hypothetical protein ACQY0O_003582 [Thecaphora frezii]
MPPRPRQESLGEARDAVDAVPRTRLTRSAASKDSIASAASSSLRSRAPSIVTSAPSPVAKPRAASQRLAKDSLRSRNNSTLSFQGSSQLSPTVEVPTPRPRGRPPSKLTASLSLSKLTASQSLSKLRKRTDEEPANATPKARARTQSSLSHLRAPSSASSSMRPSLASFQEDISRYADSEPIKAFLRIRPPPEDTKREQTNPYIEVISDTEVLMHPPKETDFTNARTAARARVHSAASATKYTFTRVFDPEGPSAKGVTKQDSSQASFFRSTTLPMVEELLQGQSGLIFTYGVTNSGKSYTVMGGDGPGEAGILPRALDAIFNSIQGLESTSDIRPVGVSGIERGDSSKGAVSSSSSVGINPFSLPGLTKKLLNEALARSLKPPKVHDHDTTKIAVDRNLRYSVWVSYVEVYNEKLFDLLDAPTSPAAAGGLSRSDSVRGSSWSIAAMANGGSDGGGATGNITLNRKPLSLKSDADGSGKFVSGLREFKVNSAGEARDLLLRGQENRAVFGTMANRASSRSHGVFTIKLVREHGGAQKPQDGDSGDLSAGYSIARLSIVDLAGSERLANTGLTSGDRLKEAGNINKSLMCLGQCLETLRKNQSRAASLSDAASQGPPPAWSGQAAPAKPEYPTPLGGNTPLRKRPSIVPFRHSKLTELFQSFFTGEGRAVMIVNANPYDTGFDENSHVMKFSAVAKEVGTTRSQLGKPKLIPSPKAVEAESELRPGPCRPGRPSKTTRASDAMLSGSEQSDGCDITVVEDDESDEEDESDPFVDLLVERHEELRQKLYAAELRCAMIENEVREEMANEMEQRLLEMQALYNQRMVSDAEQHEQFVNRKIDLLVRNNMAHEKQRSADQSSDDSELSDASRDEDEDGDKDEESGDSDEGSGAEGSSDGSSDRSDEEGDDGATDSDEVDAALVDQSLTVAQPKQSDGEESIDSVKMESLVSSASKQRSPDKPGVLAAKRKSVAVVEIPRRVSRRSSALLLETASNNAKDDSRVEMEEDELKENVQVQVVVDGDDDDDESAADEGDEDDDAEDLQNVRDDEEEAEEEDDEEDDEEDEDEDDDENMAEAAVPDSDSSFDVQESSSDEEFQPVHTKTSKAVTAATVAKPKGKGRSSQANAGRGGRRGSSKPSWDQAKDVSAIVLSDNSDASMIAEDCATPKPKRKLRKKAAVQEDDMVDQIADESLTGAVHAKTPRNTRKSMR